VAIITELSGDYYWDGNYYRFGLINDVVEQFLLTFKAIISDLQSTYWQFREQLFPVQACNYYFI
tara:strand:+ start:1379 stop:1570 length:192 start_codon:yes stop_codon:yes gene_type:complete